MISSWNFLHMFTASQRIIWSTSGPKNVAFFPARGNFPNVNISAIFHDIELKFSTHVHSLPTNYLKYLWTEKCCIFSGQRKFSKRKYLSHFSWYRAEIFYTCSQPPNELFEVPLARKMLHFFRPEESFPNVNISAIFHDIELKFSTHVHSLPTNYLKYLWPEKCCIFSGQRPT